MVVIAEIGYYYVQSRYSIVRGPYNVRHLESSLYIIDFYYKFLVENVKELADYGIFSKCYVSIRGYRMLEKITDMDNQEREEYKAQFIKIFNENYAILKNTNCYRKMSVEGRVGMYIFFKTPFLHSKIYEFVSKITE